MWLAKKIAIYCSTLRCLRKIEKCCWECYKCCDECHSCFSRKKSKNQYNRVQTMNQNRQARKQLKLKWRLIFTSDNILEMMAYLVTATFHLKLLSGFYDHHFGPIFLIFNWSVLTVFIQIVPTFGVYALMLKNILLQSFKMLPLFLIMLFGFSLGFSILKDEEISFVESTTLSLLNTMEKMLDLGSDEHNKKSFWAGTVFILFMSIMCLMLLNLFIGIYFQFQVFTKSYFTISSPFKKKKIYIYFKSNLKRAFRDFFLFLYPLLKYQYKILN